MGRAIADRLFGPHTAFADFIYPAVMFGLGVAVIAAVCIEIARL